MNRRSLAVRVAVFVAPIALTILFATAILLMAGANPLKAFAQILAGAFESPRKLADVAVAMVPLLLCSAGMLVTYLQSMGKN